MTINAFDTPDQLTAAVIGAAKAAGRVAAGRYISGGGAWKHLTALEVALCKSMDFGLFLIDEGAGDAGQFATGEAGGQAAGAVAAKVAVAMGVPSKTPIFVGVDFAADEEDIPDITAYMNGYTKGCRTALVALMYADGLIASQVPTPGGDFVPGASGWPGTPAYLKSGKVALIQHPPVQAFGIDTDPVEVVDRSVIWFPGSIAGIPASQVIVVQPPPPTQPTIPPVMSGDVPTARDRMVACVKALQTELAAQGYYSGPIDGDPGNGTVKALQAWR